MKKVFIDAGHGGNDSGAVGQGLKEKNITLGVCKKIELHLKQQGICVDMSRQNDSTVSLQTRTNKANSLKANCLVSIHCNDADNKSAQGIETFCYKFKYRALADAVHNELIATNAYTKNRGVKEGNLHMIRESAMPACLVELAFIGNKDDANLLKTKENIYTKAIAKGICKYLGVTFKENDLNTSNLNSTFKNGSYSGRKAKVTANVLNVRFDRGTQYEVIGQVKKEYIVNLEYCMNNWVSIKGFKGNKALGYIHTDYLELI